MDGKLWVRTNWEDGWPPSVGHLLEVVDTLFPLANRPKAPSYSWLDARWPLEATRWCSLPTDEQLEEWGEERVEPEGVGCSHWQNQGGGQGWGWDFSFETAEEMVDFFCVASYGLHHEEEWGEGLVREELYECEDLDSDLPDSPVVLVRPGASLERIWELRTPTFEMLAAGDRVEEATKRFFQAVDSHEWGSFTWVGTYPRTYR